MRQDDLSFRQSKEARNAVPRVAQVDRKISASRFEDGQEANNRLRATWQYDRRDRAFSEPPVCETARQFVGADVQFAVGQGGLASDDGGRVRGSRRDRLKEAVKRCLTLGRRLGTSAEGQNSVHFVILSQGQTANGSVGLSNATLKKTKKMIEHAFASRKIEKL